MLILCLLFVGIGRTGLTGQTGRTGTKVHSKSVCYGRTSSIVKCARHKRSAGLESGAVDCVHLMTRSADARADDDNEDGGRHGGDDDDNDPAAAATATSAAAPDDVVAPVAASHVASACSESACMVTSATASHGVTASGAAASGAAAITIPPDLTGGDLLDKYGTDKVFAVVFVVLYNQNKANPLPVLRIANIFLNHGGGYEYMKGVLSRMQQHLGKIYAKCGEASVTDESVLVRLCC